MSIVIGLLVLIAWGAITALLGDPVLRVLARLDGREARCLDVAEALFVRLLLGSVVIGWIGLSLLQLGAFTPLRVLLGAAVLAAALWAAGFRPVRLARLPAMTPYTWALAGMTLAGAVLLFHPDEFILGGGDAGVYVNLGAIWSHTPGFSFIEPSLGAVPPALLPGLFRQAPPTQIVDFLRFPGFYLADPGQGLVTPQFFPLHPLWLALVHGVAGLRASLFMTPLWALLGTLAIVLTVRRLFGALPSLLSGALLLLTPLQIYFARYPTAEPLTQFLTWGSLAAFLIYLAEGRAVWGVLSGLALGEVFLTRIDAVPLLVIPGLLFVQTLIRRSWRRSLSFFVPLGVLLAQALLQSLVLSRPYTWEVYSNLGRIAWALIGDYGWLLLGGLGVLAVGYALLRKLGIRATDRLVRYAQGGTALALAGLALFAYFVWPRTGHTVEAPYWYGAGVIPIQNHLNLVRLGWYLSPLGVWAGIIGILWLTVREKVRHVWPVWVVGVSFTGLYLYDILNNPFHMYAMRRYVPVVLPFFAIGMAYLVVRLWQLGSRWRLARWAGGALAGALALLLAWNSRAVWDLVEYRGLVAQVASLAGALDPGAVLLFDDAPAVGTGATLGTPLQYLYGFTAFDLQEADLDLAALTGAVAAWAAGGRSVYWVAGPQATMVVRDARELRLDPALATSIHIERLEQSYTEHPLHRVRSEIPLEVYRLTVGQDAQGCVPPAAIDVGTLDALYLPEGFYAKDTLGSRSVRWTNGQAAVALPCIQGLGAGSVEITVEAAAPRAAGMPPAGVDLLVGDRVVAHWTLAGAFETLNARVPAADLIRAGGVVRLVSDTWVPADHGVGTDTRVLGVLIDAITIVAGDTNG